MTEEKESSEDEIEWKKKYWFAKPKEEKANNQDKSSSETPNKKQNYPDEKALSEKRKEWVEKWVHKKLTGRAIVEFKQDDARAVERLKPFLTNLGKLKLMEIFGDLK